MTGDTGQSVRIRRLGTRRKVVVVIAGLVLAVVAVDAVARVAVESEVEGRLQALAQVTERPSVRFRGIFFLPQVIAGSFQQVDVSNRAVNGTIRVESLQSQLLDVRVPFHDVLVRDVHVVGIAHSVERAKLSYQDINAYLESTQRPLRLARTPDGQVQVTGSVMVAGQPVQGTAQVTLSVEDGAVRVTPRQIDTGSGTLDQATRLLLGDRLAFRLPIGQLPYGQQLTAAAPYSDGIEVEAQGTGIILQAP